MFVASIRTKCIFGVLFLITLLALLARPAEAQTQPMDPMADLSVQKFDFPPEQVAVGEPLFYELSVANFGPDTAENAVVDDSLPANTEFLFTISGDCTNSGQNVTCDLGDLATGEQAVVEFAVCPTEPGTATNTATARSDTQDPDTSNNTATESTEVTTPAVGACPSQEETPPQEEPPQPQPETPDPPAEEPVSDLIPEGFLEPNLTAASITGDENVIQQQTAGIVQDCRTVLDNRNGELEGSVDLGGADCRATVDQSQTEEDAVSQVSALGAG